MWYPRSGVVAVLLLPACVSGREDTDAPATAQETNPLGANAACYVCHIPLVHDELSKVHLRVRVTCSDCHGLSAAHANDEEIGATPPDTTFTRGEVNGFCRDCHVGHDVRPEKVVARALERQMSTPAAVCTDCHGTHRLEETAGS